MRRFDNSSRPSLQVQHNGNKPEGSSSKWNRDTNIRPDDILHAKLGEQNVEIQGLVSEHVASIMIGIEWLADERSHLSRDSALAQ